jgi:prevent-host-death family protein
MERHMSATEARVHFGEVLRDVTERGATVVVERGGKPEAVVLSLEEYRRLKSGRVEKPRWKTLLEEAHQQIQREGNLPLNPTPEDLIRKERERRGEQILDSLR